MTGGEADAAFKPASIELRPGETVKITLKNSGSISHEVRVAGADGKYDTSDDFVSTSADSADIIKPGEEGFLVVRLDDEGEYEFQDPTSPNAQGTIVVKGEPVTEEPTPTPSPGAQEPVDVTLDVVVRDNGFEPGKLEVARRQEVPDQHQERRPVRPQHAHSGAGRAVRHGGRPGVQTERD